MIGSLHTEVRGDPSDGHTVVFLPGLGGTTRYWASRVAALQDRYRIVLVDLLGFGDAPRPWIRYGVARHVEALGDALRPYGRATLVGHSLGALLAIAYDPPAIFVTAIDTEPLAPDPAVVVGESPQAFVDGLRVLTRLTSGTVYVCTAAGGRNVDTDTERVETVAFARNVS